MAGNAVELPAGFILDAPAAPVNALPPGFVLDAPADGGMPDIPGFTPMQAEQTPGGEYVVPSANKGSTQPIEPTMGAAADVPLSFASGVGRGIVGIPGIPGSIEALIRSAQQRLPQALQPSALQPQTQPTLGGQPPQPDVALPPVETTFPTSQDVVSGFERNVFPFHNPQTRAGRYAETIGEFLPAAALPVRAVGLPAQIATRVGSNVLAPAVASEAAGQATEGTAFETPSRIVAALLAPYAPRLAMRAVTPLPAPANRTAAADALAAEGVDLTAGQRTGNVPLQYAESAASETPFGGGRAQQIFERQGEQFTRAALRRIGVDADRATPDVMEAARQRLNAEFNRLTAGNTIRFTGRGGAARGRTLENTALRLEADYNAIVPESLQRNPLVHEMVDDVANAVAQGRIDGRAYQQWRSTFSDMAAQHRDPAFQRFLRGLRDAMDDAMASGIPAAEQAAWQTARQQWGALLDLQRALARTGEQAASGIITPAALGQSDIRANARAHVEGTGRFSDLSSAGMTAMSPRRNSGTPGRLMAMSVPAALASTASHLLGGEPVGPAVAASLAGPALGARALMSRPVQAWLARQTLAGPLNAGAMQPASAVARALMLPAQMPQTLGGQ